MAVGRLDQPQSGVSFRFSGAGGDLGRDARVLLIGTETLTLQARSAFKWSYCGDWNSGRRVLAGLIVCVEMVWFDSVRWSDLHPDVWQRVLACLPGRALCRFRTVCKAWRSLVMASSFRKLRGGLRQRVATILVRNGYKAVEVYDRDESKWVVMDVLFLRDAFEHFGVKDYKIEAAGGGLLAVWPAPLDEGKAVVLCNPVAKTWRYLPPMVIHLARRTVVHMVVGSETSVVRIFVHGIKKPGSMESFQIYDSGVDSWRLCSSPSRALRSRDPLSGLLYNGSFHALFYDIVAQNHVLMAYDAAVDVWADARVHFPRLFKTGELLVANSRLYLVTPCKDTGAGQPSRFVLNVDISEIRISAGECARVRQLPSPIFNLLFGGSHRVGLDSWVTMVFDQSICIVSYLGLAVVHNEVTDQWQPLIPCVIGERDGQFFGSSFTIDVCMPV